MVLPIRVWGMDSSGKPFMEVAHTLDVNPAGARIAGLRRVLALDDIIGIQYRHQKARFRVCWVGRIGKDQEEVLFGVQCLDSNKEIWGLKQEGAIHDDYVAPVSKEEKNHPGRRVWARFPVSGEADIRSKDGKASGGNLSDLSMQGCYVGTHHCFTAGTEVKVDLQVAGSHISGKGVVRNSHPGVGMGVQFTQIDAQNHERLKKIIDELQGGTSEQADSLVQDAKAEPAPAAPAKLRISTKDLTIRVQAAASELREIEELIRETEVDPIIHREFRESVGHVRSSAWAVQRWMEMQAERQDPLPVLTYLNNERIRMATQISRNLLHDLKAMELKAQKVDLRDLLHSVEDLFTHLAGLEVDVYVQRSEPVMPSAEELAEVMHEFGLDTNVTPEGAASEFQGRGMHSNLGPEFTYPKNLDR